jgi:hypothetical protein
MNALLYIKPAIDIDLRSYDSTVLPQYNCAVVMAVVVVSHIFNLSCFPGCKLLLERWRCSRTSHAFPIFYFPFAAGGCLTLAQQLPCTASPAGVCSGISVFYMSNAAR